MGLDPKVQSIAFSHLLFGTSSSYRSSHRLGRANPALDMFLLSCKALKLHFRFQGSCRICRRSATDPIKVHFRGHSHASILLKGFQATKIAKKEIWIFRTNSTNSTTARFLRNSF